MISPRPWRWVEGGQMEPNDEDRDFLIKAINSYVEKESS